MFKVNGFFVAFKNPFLELLRNFRFLILLQLFVNLCFVKDLDLGFVNQSCHIDQIPTSLHILKVKNRNSLLMVYNEVTRMEITVDQSKVWPFFVRFFYFWIKFIILTVDFRILYTEFPTSFMEIIEPFTESYYCFLSQAVFIRKMLTNCSFLHYNFRPATRNDPRFDIRTTRNAF